MGFYEPHYVVLKIKNHIVWFFGTRPPNLSGDTTRCLLFYRNRGRGYSGLGSPFSLFRALLYFRFGVWLRVSPQTAESPLLSRGTFLCGERVVCSVLVFLSRDKVNIARVMMYSVIRGLYCLGLLAQASPTLVWVY